jgi:hypothetical protein
MNVRLTAPNGKVTDQVISKLISLMKSIIEISLLDYSKKSRILECTWSWRKVGLPGETMSPREAHSVCLPQLPQTASKQLHFEIGFVSELELRYSKLLEMDLV